MRLLLSVFCLGSFGCGGETASLEAGSAAVLVAPVFAAAFDASSYEAQLAAADAVDGTVDHVVTQCAGCGLGMSGDPSHAAQIGDYELHLCSSSCQENFVADPAVVLGRLPAN